jgi:hypothetical protein
MNKEFDVSISFSGNDRDKAEALFQELKKNGVLVFYDKEEQHRLWGKDLYSFLTEIYQKKSQYCIILISQDYLKSHWPNLERKAAQANQLILGDQEYILPIRIDDSELPGLLPTTSYVRWTADSPKDIVNLFLKKLNLNEKIMPLNDLKCFWWQDLLQPGLENKEPRPAHIIEKTVDDETPAGTETFNYVAYCGKEMEAWHFHHSISGQIGTLGEAKRLGYKLCANCAWRYNKLINR